MMLASREFPSSLMSVWRISHFVVVRENGKTKAGRADRSATAESPVNPCPIRPDKITTTHFFGNGFEA
jgi:hypothetical protein